MNVRRKMIVDTPKIDNKPTATVNAPSMILGKSLSELSGTVHEEKHTNIQDHPSRPSVPLMKEMPYAKIPENAPEYAILSAEKLNIRLYSPAIVAPPQNMPMRSWSLWRGYHIDKLRHESTYQRTQ